MSLNLPITGRRIKNHFHYSLWKYLVLILIAMFGWNLIYTTTRYRPPESAKIEFFAEGVYSSDEKLQELADKIHAEIMPEMEEVTATSVTFDDAYGDMQLVVWVSAAQGDVYLISKARFQSIADNEGALDLTPYVESGALHTDGIDLTNGYVRTADHLSQTLMGIPADTLTGLNDYGVITDGMMLCVLVNGGNDEYAIRFLDYLLTYMHAEKPVVSPVALETVLPSAQPAATVNP